MATIINIVYPIQGGTYPISNPLAGVLGSHYLTVSFGVTNPGDLSVEWGFDASPAIGKARFYDMISVQQVYKLPGGTHEFWVKAGGTVKVKKFKIGA